ncbi:hypothetical protein ACFZBP_03475 [Streptomyces sp. NPDC008086]|uniref:hypothetical protein n=1 Tax=Streptomyces sp. NPDC008086 TaxID=3364807 RepID=UPI0036E8C066
MTAGWCSRTLRAAVFAAVCVLLAALGHVMMSGTTVPWWAMAAGAAVTGGAAWLSAAGERGPVVVGSAVVAAQTALHVSFSLAQTVVHPAASGAVGSMAHMGSMHAPDHGMGGMPSTGMPSIGISSTSASSTGMLAAHLLAALLCGLWLAHGERAAFRILRVLGGWLGAPLRLTLRSPAPPHRPRVSTSRARSDHRPRHLDLTHAITSRGPPTGTAVA